MTAADVLIKQTGRQIDELPEDQFGGVLFDEARLGDLPEPDYFLEPEPDVIDEPMDPELARRVVAERIILGAYIPMSSPGQVVLNGRRLEHFFWSLIRRIRPSIPYLTKAQLRLGLELVIQKTYQHEVFHYRSDVLRQMFQTPHDRLSEEALAVAWSRLWLARQHADGRKALSRLNDLLFSSLMREAYQYRSAGYRDWVLYADEARFKPAWLAYLGPGNRVRLLGNGVELEDLMYWSLDQVRGGYIEYVV